MTLTVGSVAALVWANVDGSAYAHVWRTVPSWLAFADLHFTARQWVNDGLMTLFFVGIGLEIRREARAGELRSWDRAAAPMVAAVVGMAVPALLYGVVAHGTAGGHGWGIPMATDVAFSLGALALLAPRASLRLRVFLMTLGVADDILSILVLIAVYSAEVKGGYVAAGVLCLVAMALLRASPRMPVVAAIVLGVAAWWAFGRGGVEAAVTGVAVGLFGLASPVPPADVPHAGPRAWEQRLTPVVNLLALPVFALANAGVDIAHADLSSGAALTVFVAVLVGRVVGKPLGVWLGTTLVPSRFALPAEHRSAARTRLGLGTVASVGFTVSLLIARVAFGDGRLADSATAALLLSTVVAVGVTAPLLHQPG